MAFSTKKGPNFGNIKWALAGWCFEIKLIPLAKVQTTPRPRRKWFVFWKNLILYQVEISEKLQLGTKLSFFKKQIIFFWALGLFTLLPKELILFQNTTPQEPILYIQNLAPFSWKTPYSIKWVVWEKIWGFVRFLWPCQYLQNLEFSWKIEIQKSRRHALHVWRPSTKCNLSNTKFLRVFHQFSTVCTQFRQFSSLFFKTIWVVF